MATRTLTESNFEETVTGDGIVLVDYWAEWCPPCRMFGPVFEKSSEQHDDIVFGKVDTDAEQGIPVVRTIRSIPTLQAYRDGILVFSQAGALPSAQLEKVISAVRELDMVDVRAKASAASAS